MNKEEVHISKDETSVKKKCTPTMTTCEDKVHISEDETRTRTMCTFGPDLAGVGGEERRGSGST